MARIGDVLVGTCLMVRHELEPAHDLTPWLAGLVVEVGQRGRGIGAALVRAIEAHALEQNLIIPAHILLRRSSWRTRLV
ncbi:GNAT family N-acetyltransferase [Mesorhizobium sp. PAMC28654]|uniref:GNAT family N-acetyltransferase n=1 Tax=Mesorhizobium sp. PAMC28654 TaxID=2880934 RepID=UPI0039B5B6EA